MLNALKDTNIYLPTLLAVGLGLRRGEVLGLQWDNIDFEKNLISIKRAYIPTPKGNVFSEVKTEKSKRTIGVPKDIMQYLKYIRTRQVETKLLFGGKYNDFDLVC
jgi:integrase